MAFTKEFSVVNETKVFSQPTKMVYPQAPFRAVTFYKTTNTSSWYEIMSDPAKLEYLKPELTFNNDHIKAQCKIINALIATEISLFDDKDSNRVFL